jgi:hypothetical protein
MSRDLDNQQNYSAYLLFAAGVVLFILNCKLINNDTEEKTLVNGANNLQNQENNVKIIQTKENNSTTVINLEPVNNPIVTKVSNNPYDIPEDF